MEFRAVDDGEPSGSAGKPILFAIKKFDFSDILVVVTRYFGGVKLGVGGLARAYGEASELALAESKSKPVHITTPVQIFCTYEDIDIIKKLVIQSAISFKEDYQDAVKIIANIHRSKVNPFISQITESTKGRAGAIILTNTESI
jgi:putative IMPACT (imprinted ancient) family translation regulator